DQIILAAADVDVDLFRQLAGNFPQVARRTTLYVSAKDQALAAAQWLYGSPRAGYVPPVTVVPGIDTVEVSNVDLTQLGHGYFAGSQVVLSDMALLLRHGHPPTERPAVYARRNEAGDQYWSLVP